MHEQMSMSNEVSTLPKCMPNAYWYGEETRVQQVVNDKGETVDETVSENLLVMDKLGKSIDRYYNLFVRNFQAQFSFKDVAKIAVQGIKILQTFHGQKLLHRDIKPQNIVLGTGSNQNKIYFIDFGLVKIFEQDGQHIEFREDKSLVGTPKYKKFLFFLLFEFEQHTNFSFEPFCSAASTQTMEKNRADVMSKA